MPTNTLSSAPRPSVRIGLALGGGFARGIAHAGVLQVLQEHRIPIHCMTGVSAGAVAAAAYASGTTPDEIAHAGCALRLADVGEWRPGRLGLVRNQCLTRFFSRLLQASEFEGMRIPLGVVATDFYTGAPVSLHGRGSVFDALRASCAFPGLFQPVRHGGRMLVDGAMSVQTPVELTRQLGATHVISVTLPPPTRDGLLGTLLGLLKRRFQRRSSRAEAASLARDADLVIAPDVSGVAWHAFGSGPLLVAAGREAARSALPVIRQWLRQAQADGDAAPVSPAVAA